MARKIVENNSNIFSGKYRTPSLTGKNTPVNSPKNSTITSNCLAIANIITSPIVGDLTGFGHKVNCKGGVIDLAIFSGKVTGLESFITALQNSGLSIVESDRKKYASDTFRSVLAKRVVDHIKWCSNTLNNSHGGFGSRLAKVGQYANHSELSGLLENLATLLDNTYSVQFSGLYRKRNTTGLAR